MGIAFAAIKDNVVVNIFSAPDYNTANMSAKSAYGSDAIAKDITLYDIEKGYTYDRGSFYDEYGNEIQRNLTLEERVCLLEGKMKSVKEHISYMELVNEFFGLELPEELQGLFENSEMVQEQEI